MSSNKTKQGEDAVKKYNSIHKDIEKEESSFMKNICDILNRKKCIIRKLQREYDGVEEIEVEKVESKVNSSFRKDEDANQSQTLSLSDLI
jgi:hypothetical protein